MSEEKNMNKEVLPQAPIANGPMNSTLNTKPKEFSEEEIKVRNRNSAENIKKYAIDQELFDTPTMGDFYLGGIDDIYLRKMDAIVNGPADNIEDAEALDGNGKSAAFYTDSPAFSKTGTDGKGHLFFKAALDGKGSLGDWLNGNTIRVRLSDLSVEDDGDPKALELFKKSVMEKDTPLGKMKEDDFITVKLYGINAPFPDRYAIEEQISKHDFQHISLPAKDVIGKSSKFTCEPEYTAESEMFDFVKVGSRWYQYKVSNEDEKTISFKWLVCPRNGATKSAEAASAKIAELTAQYPLYIMIDDIAGDSKTHTNFEYISDNHDACETLKKWAGELTHGTNTGYCLAKQDYAGRFSGSAYIKIDGKWVNLAKAVLSDSENNEAAADNLFMGDDEEVFKPNYDMSKQNFADAYFTLWSELDDRAAKQSKIFGQKWDELKDWTVTIGDVTLMIPPTSITISNITNNDATPILRGRGCMPKGSQYNVKTIQMPIYFSGDKGINGYKVKEETPHGQEFTYSMNGLRALISEFKFTPFLPIENTYINDVLGVTAVVFDNITVSSVDGHPTLMQAYLTMREFCYEAYIPEVIAMAAEMNAPNAFSTAINWKTMRYYYQRAIMAGDKLRNVGYDINSKEYLHEALKNRTALQPMLFQSNSIDFFLADPEYLDKMLASKRMRDKMLNNAIRFDDDEQAVMSDMSDVASLVNDSLASPEFQKACEELRGIRLQANPSENNSESRVYTSLPANAGIYAVDEEGNIRNDIDVNARITTICSTLLEKVKANESVLDAKVFYEQNKADKKITFGVAVKLRGAKGDTLDKLKVNLKPIAAVNDEEVEYNRSFLKDGWIKIPFSAYEDFDKNKPGGVSIDSNDPDAKVLQFALDRKESNVGGNGEKDDGWQVAPSIAQLDNMKFKKVNTGIFYVTSFNAQLNNVFSNIHLQNTGRTCAQFLGGQDTSFEIQITTTDKEAVRMLEALPDLAAYMLRKYRRIIPCYPIKIDSEFSRFLGVTEVMVDNVTVSTVGNHPGAYHIYMSLHSMDRTMRAREAMEMIQADNGGYRASSYADDIADAIKGKDRTKEYRDKQYKSYFDILDTISHAELYPDLELPRIDEMATLGYEFIRYKFQDNRVFVDPDFYFVYMSRLSSQVLRETIINSVKSGIDGSHEETDSSGATFSISTAQEKAFESVAKNDMAKGQLEKIKKMNDAQFELNAKQTPENLIDKSRAGFAVEDYEGWEICNDIKVMFMERRYKKEADSYDARKKNDSIQNKKSFEQPGATPSGVESAQATDDTSSVKGTNDTSSVKSTNDTSNTESTNDASGVKATNDTSSVKGAGAGKDDAETAKKKYTEGAWVISQLANANKAAELIADYLLNKPIEMEAPANGAIRDKYQAAKKSDSDTASSYSSMKTEIQNGVTAFFNIGEIRQIMELLNIQVDSNFLSVTKDIIFASACAATGSKEWPHTTTTWLIK